MNAQVKSLYVSFLSEINPTTSQALLGAIGAQLPQGFDELHLLLSTPGGNVREGVALYNALRALPIKLITYNIGTVNSVGNVVFLAGEERYAAPISSFMFHGVGFDIKQTRFEEKTLVERLDSLRNDQALLADIITERTNINSEEVKSLFLRAGFLRAEEAKACGIIHDIREIKVPKGTPFIQLVFKS